MSEMPAGCHNLVAAQIVLTARLELNVIVHLIPMLFLVLLINYDHIFP